MKIIFACQHNYWGGLSNTGGSRTIIASCKALNSIGHKTQIVTRSDKCTLFKHKKPLKTIPHDTDVCIACSVSDIDPMLKTMPKNAKAYWWCRLVENHSMAKKKILKKASKVNVIVNSENLHDWFKAHEIKSRIAYQGVDINKWRDLCLHQKGSIGFLVSSKPRKHFDFAMEVIKKLGPGYRYYGYGVDLNGKIKNFIKDRFFSFVKNADYSSLIRIYNMVDIWVATSTKEGLHNSVLEAGLCGCTIVYPDAPLAGCSDHCNEQTAWKYKALDVDSAMEAIRTADNSRNEAHKELIIKKIGNREQAMRNFVEILK
ncbi:MAG: glycosyltransferase [Desulfobacterales bacterium]